MAKSYQTILILTFILVSNLVFSQNSSPYQTSFKKDSPILAAGFGLIYLGGT